MNRIYQGRVTKIEIAGGKDEKGNHSTSNRVRPQRNFSYCRRG